MLKIGDTFWEYNHLGYCYPRIAHTEIHIQYFLKKYKVVTFYSLEELLATYPNAIY